jgi:hypothetical protein
MDGPSREKQPDDAAIIQEPASLSAADFLAVAGIFHGVFGFCGQRHLLLAQSGHW